MAEHATVADCDAICELINYYAERGRMLHRSLESTVESIREFLVARRDGRVAGCVALPVSWKDLGELRSLAVRPGFEGRGVGRELVDAALDDARRLGLQRVFVLTYVTDFFERFGFRVVDKQALPTKVWRVCIHCDRADACDETAMILDL
jgi:amino-acid N-acetyltransferase